MQLREQVVGSSSFREGYSENGKLKLSLLSPNGPSRWYNYPSTPTILYVPMTDILTVVEPHTTTGRSYSLTLNESKAATRKFKCLLNI